MSKLNETEIDLLTTTLEVVAARRQRYLLVRGFLIGLTFGAFFNLVILWVVI